MITIILILILVVCGGLGYVYHVAQKKTKSLKGPLSAGTKSNVVDQTDPGLQKKYLDLHRRLVMGLSGNYVDLKVIAEGGMGVIASAYDTERKRNVAIKTILPELQEDHDVVGLFLQECQVIQSMNHPNVVRIFEVGQSDQLYYYVMDFLEGETIEDRIDRKKKLPLEEVLRYATQVARALQHIHSNGLIHRDIKPSNIFITTNYVAKIIDFGIAKLLHAKPTYSYSSVGSPVYASPEQIQGQEVSGKTDIYSLGVVMFYMLTGQHPFERENLLSKMFDAPKDILTLNPKIPDKLASIVYQCIHADPQERLPAHELWARLRSIRI